MGERLAVALSAHSGSRSQSRWLSSFPGATGVLAKFCRPSGSSRRCFRSRPPVCALELRWVFGGAGLAFSRPPPWSIGGCSTRFGLGHIAMSSNPLVGTWRLISWENRTLDGEVSHPLGEDASGYIAYNEDGYVFVAIMGPARRPFVAAGVLSGSTAEKAGAAETYVLLRAV